MRFKESDQCLETIHNNLPTLCADFNKNLSNRITFLLDPQNYFVRWEICLWEERLIRSLYLDFIELSFRGIHKDSSRVYYKNAFARQTRVAKVSHKLHLMKRMRTAMLLVATHCANTNSQSFFIPLTWKSPGYTVPRGLLCQLPSDNTSQLCLNPAANRVYHSSTFLQVSSENWKQNVNTLTPFACFSCYNFQTKLHKVRWYCKKHFIK